MSDGLLLARTLVTGADGGAGSLPRRGAALADPSVVPDGALAWRDGVVIYAGPADRMPEDARPLFGDGRGVHRTDGAVIPGFVDCHTHLPFIGWRADEFEARLTGRTYQDLQGGGGGIFRSSRMLNGASDDEVLEFCAPLADDMLRHGTTAFELKTGYGLSVEAELRQARLARRLGERVAQTTTVTLLACHAAPEGVRRDEWVEIVRRELIPAAADERLVDAVDVYVEDIAFGVDDLRAVAEAAGERGLALRCHADQLGASGAAEAAASLGARSADHLNHVSTEGITALGSGQTAAVLLPVSTLFIRADPAPAPELLAAGAPVALATDFNPGTSPCLSMPEVIGAAAAIYRIPPLTAFTAATANPAWVLGLHDRLGTLEPGKRADFVVLDAADPAMIPYRPGHNPVEQVWIAGEPVVGASRAG